ncbi:winged helix-turn-helix domain-containing protein [Microbispora sp. ATCC PTA-5024]|uniref:winged helix-turn-helix domain-containing protein n=1 Tax=Microbispora sp. ATCC PTA-5024 TaxID=316330 RepID=UPI00042729B8|nr:winged helix-turn-helix domain-containing protein [Microbispora sp. ATCC PTA-5024]
MSQQNVIDFAGRQRGQGHEQPPQDDGTVLGVLPLPETGATLVIVGYLVPSGRAAEERSAIPAVAAEVVHRLQDLPLHEERPAGHAPAAGEGRAVRRGAHPEEDLVVDRAARVVRVDGEEIELTFREFELLDYLSSAPGRVYNRRQLLAAVWDRYGEEGARTVDVHVLRLRRKLGRHAARIVTVRNVGYKYQPSRRS